MKEKKNVKSAWENFWYYYKYHVLAVLFVVFILGVFIRDKTSQIEYDYRVAVLTEREISEKELEILRQSFEAVALDLDQNNAIQIEVRNYVTAKEKTVNPQVEMANQTKLLGDVQTGASMIFLYSDAVYEMYKDEGIFDVQDTNHIKLSQCKAYRGRDLADLNVSMRVVKGTSLEKKKDKMAYYAESKDLLERFQNGQ